MSEKPIRVAVTGAAGAIGYSLLFRIADGAMLGPDQHVHLQLVEIPDALSALEGVAMELDDGAHPLVAGVDLFDDPVKGLDGVQLALLVGSRPRTKGMERADLLEVNGKIFTGQGKALNDGAADDVRILVVGNPANTNALIAMNNAPDIPRERFTAMTRLDHNRAKAQLAAKAGAHNRDVTNLTIWGNHSPTMYPDIFHAKVGDQAAFDAVGNDQQWLEDDFIPTVAKRGAAIIEARGSSSAASAAGAAVDHVRDWAKGTPDGDWTSMAVCSDGSYGVEEGLISSFPVTTSNGKWEIVQGLEVSEFSQGRIDKTVDELKSERDTVKSQGMF